jgi:hypothetical protein
MPLRWPPSANGSSRRKTTLVERLERAGLLAPEGDVDKILQTVVNNIEITNNIELPRPVRTRVLTTSPLETFSVGNTIVVSRGLIDVLPDEGSLAMVLSHELAHIVLGHNLGSQYAFNDRMLFSDEGTYQNLGFKHIPEEETAADKKAIEMLKSLALRAEAGFGGPLHQKHCRCALHNWALCCKRTSATTSPRTAR